MKHIGKRAFAALALAGLIPSTSLAQGERPICKDETRLNDKAFTVTEVTQLGQLADARTLKHRVILKPENSLSELEASNLPDGPILTLEQQFKPGGNSLLAGLAKAEITAVSDQWRCADLIVSNETVAQQCVGETAGLITFDEVAFDIAIDNPARLEVKLGDDTVQNRPAFVYDKSAAAISFSDFATDKILTMWNRSSRGECVPIQEDCFLTTATCEVIGLADDCWELQTLRRFRDSWLSRQPGGSADIARYYRDAPQIAERLRRDPDAAVREYWRFILPSAIAASLGANETARTLYTRGMNRLAGKIV